MFQLLKEKLILLYTLSTGLILITVVIIILIFTERQFESKKIKSFQDNISTIVTKLQFENSISYTWLSEMEAKNHLLIHIEDNGNSLTFPGAITTPTDRELLFTQLNTLALKESIDISIYPIFFNEVRSSIFTIEGSKKDVYYGHTVIIPTSFGWKSLSILKYLPGNNASIRNQRIIFLSLGFLGIIALYIVSLNLVTKLLKPIEENNEKQTRFIASASHELRSPLSVICANNSAIPSTSLDAQKFITGIDQECKRMARLLDDMLLLASTDAKTWSVKKEQVEADTLLIETYESFLPLCKQKGHQLLLEIPEYELPIIYGDKERLQQVLSILLDNALSYTPIHKDIILRGYLTNNHLYLEVADQGIGIADEYKKLIFDRFYKVDQSRNDKQHFGLGLSIAKELIGLQGGKISIRDTMGGGSTFVIRF